MNIIELLSNEIAAKNWSKEEKARYLYIRCCQLFTYDPRYACCDKIPNGEKLKQEILDKKIDLENVTDNWAVCTSFTKEIYIKLLKILLNIDAVPKKLNDTSVHVWTEFYDGTRIIKADSAIKACKDLLRAKIGLETQEYISKSEEKDFKHQLYNIDKTIGYVTNQYENKHLENLKQKLITISKTIENKDEVLMYKWKIIQNELKKYSQTSYPVNLHAIMHYLLLHLLTSEDIAKIKIKKLFQVTNDNEWCFANIYTLLLDSQTLYYIQPRYQNNFNFYEISSEQTTYYQSKMRCL